MENKRKNLKKNQIVAFLITIAIVALVNVIGSYVFTRFDLTSEKRYTLSPATKEVLNGLEDYVYFKVYLDGDFPANFKKLRRETKEMLDEFRAYSKYIEYEIVDPYENPDEVDHYNTDRQLYQSGLDFVDLEVEGSNGMASMRVWPGALVSYRNETKAAVQLFEGGLYKLPKDQNVLEDKMIISTQDLEFHLIDAVKKAIRLERSKIAFLEGHGELSNEELSSIAQILSKNYDIKRLAIEGKIDKLLHRTQDTTRDVKVFPSYDAIVIAKPTEPFDEKDKFLIDQYIMHGGKVLWLVEPVYATMDSLQNQESTIGIEQDLNLDDMLFRYGVRLNRDLLLDLTCAPVPWIEAGVRTFYPWYYFPLLKAASDHPIVRNMNGIRSDFISSMDATTSANGIEQIPLLKTSSYTKVSGVPVFISLAMLRQKPNQRMFNIKDGKNVAYLLKGSFTSLYANRIPQEIVDDQATDFMEESVPTAMIVVSDGDIIRNQFDIKTGAPLPLGQDRFSKHTYNNQSFIENAISYLVEGEDMIDIRSRTLSIRLLDSKKVSDERVKWQVINTVIPIGIIIVLGLVMAFVRKKKYSKTERHEEK